MYCLSPEQHVMLTERLATDTFLRIAVDGFLRPISN